MPSQRSFTGLSGFSTNNLIATAQQVQATVGRGNLGWGLLCNAATLARYVKFYDRLTAPVVGTDTPKYRIYIPPTSTVDLTGGKQSLWFSQGIWVAATTGVADTNSTNPSTNDVIVNLGYAP